MVNGLVGASIQPVEAAVGGGEAHGKASTCHAVPTPLFVHPKVTVLAVIALETKAVGCKQVGGGAHVISAIQPGKFTDASLLNLKVKQPSGLEEVKGPGIVVPQ